MLFPRRRRSHRATKRRRHLLESLEGRRLLATYTVDSTDDNTQGICAADNPAGNSNCTIRLAIQEAEANPGPDTIQIGDGNYLIDPVLGSFNLLDTEDTSFVGNTTNAAAVVIDGQNQSRVFLLGGAGVAPFNVSFQGLTIQTGIADDGFGGGGINANDQVNLSLNLVVVQNNVAAENAFLSGDFSSGGGIEATGSVTLVDTIIRDNTATAEGGGINIFEGEVAETLSVSNSTFSGNSAASRGGGLYLRSGASASLDNVVFDDNVGADSGGGVYSERADLSVSNSTFTNNRATLVQSGGGGLYLFGSATSPAFSVVDTNFQNNQAVDGGGGLEVFGVAGTISGGTFVDNQSTGTGVTFDQGGAGIAVLGNQTGTPPLVSISGVTVQNNTGPAAAGIALVDANVTIVDSIIRNNSATETLAGGGGIGAINTVPGATLTIERTLIAGNTTAAEAGGLGAIDVALDIIDSTIDGNIANGGRAGGIGLIGNTQTPVATISSSTVSNNFSIGDGGGIGLFAAGLQLTNVTVTGNVSQSGAGGGIAHDNSSGAPPSSISFSTIAVNNAPGPGSNIAAQGTTPLEVNATIVDAGDCTFDSGALSSTGFNIDAGTTCSFNQPTDQSSTDPLLGPLQDNTGPVFTMALGQGSPAIDMAGGTFPATDARGIERPQDGDGDSDGIPDVGAFEAEGLLIPRLTVSDVFFEESTGNATVLVTLDVDAAGPFTVDFTTVDDTATAPGDYLANAGTLNFNGNAGEQQPITITLVDDSVAEADERFQVTLNSPSDSIDVSDIGIISIFDDDTAKLFVDDPAAAEDGGSVSVTVTLTGQTDAPFTVDLTTLDLPGGATAGVDYTALTDTLNFAGNDGEVQTFTVALTADTDVEPDELFRVEASNITAGTRNIAFDNFADRIDIVTAGQFAPGGIDANDVALSTPDPSTTIAYVADASGLLVLDVSDPASVVQLGAFPLADEALQIETVDVAFFDGVVYIAAGDAGLEVLDVSDPANISRLGSFSVPGVRALSLARNGSTLLLGESDATLTTGGLRILDISDPSNITQLGLIQTNIPAALDVDLDGATAYVAASTGGLQVIDVSNPAIPVTLGSFDTITARVVTFSDDLAYVGTPAGLSVLDVSDPGTIVDLGFFATAAAVNGIDLDNDFDTIVSVTDESGTFQSLRLNDAGSVDVLGTFTLSTAARGFDIEGLTAYVAGDTGGVQILRGDLVAESTVTILNDDLAQVTVSDVTVNEGAGTATVNVAVDRAVSGGFTVDVTTNDGTAIAPDDFTQTSMTLTFSGTAGQSQTFTIPIISDAISESEETFTVSASNVIPLGNVSPQSIDTADTGTVTITETVVQLGSIRGFVFFDDDGDGTRLRPGPDGILGTADDEEDRRLENRVVVLEQGGGLGGFTQVDTFTTFADGNYNFPDLAAGQYRVSSFQILTGGGVIDSGLSEATPQPVLINLQAGENYFAVANNPPVTGEVIEPDLAIGLTDQSITVFVYNDVDRDGTPRGVGPDQVLGTADDTDDAPVVDASVTLFGDIDSDNVDETVTIPHLGSGRYFIDRVATGDYLVSIAAPAGFDVTTPTSTNLTIQLSNDFVPQASQSPPPTEVVDPSLGFGIAAQVAPQVDLTTNISDDFDPLNVGETITFTIPITNIGTDFASDVVSTTTLPPEFSIDSATNDFFNATTSVSGNVVTSTLPALDAGITATVTVVASATAAGDVTTTTTVTSSDADVNGNNNAAAEPTTINALVGSTVDIAVADDSFDQRPGPGTTYVSSFRITNVSSTDATNIALVITLDANVTFDSASTSSGLTFVQNGDQLTATISNLAAGAVEFVDLNLTTVNNVPSGTVLSNTLSATPAESDADTTNNTATSQQTVTDFHTLSTGTGDGDVTIQVNPFGVFGSAVGPPGIDALYDPIGPVQQASAVFRSALAVRESATGSRTFLDRIPVSEARPNSITGNLTTATSNFSIGSFDVQVVQTVAPNFDDAGVRIGARLDQTYTVTNNSAAATLLDVVRYLDADLLFDRSRVDGGGQLIGAGGEIVLFETDAGGTGATDTTFVGITASGGLPLTTGRFMVDNFSALASQVEDGTDLLETVLGDNDGDNFVDVGQEYDVGLALRHQLNIGTGQSAEYKTTTLFGERPESVVPPGSSVNVPGFARAIEFADVDNDGDQDLLVASEGVAAMGVSPMLTVLENDGGQFTVLRQTELGERPQSISVWTPPGSNQTPVIAVAGVGTVESGGKIYTIVGNSVTSHSAGDGPVSIVVDDLDNNQQADILVASLRSSNANLALNPDLNLPTNDSIDFDPIARVRQARAVATGNLDGLSGNIDRRDIVLAGYGYGRDTESELKVLLADDGGGFTEADSVTTDKSVVSVIVADFDPQTETDEILTLSATGALNFYRFENNALSGPIRTVVTEGASAFDVGDITGDAILDVAVANLGDQRIDIFAGDGSGAFSLVRTILDVPAPADLAVVDLNGDGVSEIAVANLFSVTGRDSEGKLTFGMPSMTQIVDLGFSANPVPLASGSPPEAELALDVNRDNQVTAGDALRVINALNRPQAEGESVAASSRAATDVNGDGTTSALDALLVINYLSAEEAAVAEAEAWLTTLEDNDDDRDEIIAAIDLLLTHGVG